MKPVCVRAAVLGRMAMIAALLPLAAPAWPTDGVSPVAEASAPVEPLVLEALSSLRDDDVRVATIAWRVAVASADICPRTQPLGGLVVHDLGQYRSRFRAGAMRLFGADRGIGLQGVVPGSPAEKAGLRANDMLVALDGVSVDTDGVAEGQDRMPAIRAMIDTAMRDGQARVSVLRDGRPVEVLLSGVPGCASRIEVRASAAYNGWADGVTAQISSAMVDFTRDDDELAAVIAHEMAHNILRHRERLNAAGLQRGLLSIVGRNARLIRTTEIEADRLSVYLVARAGFDMGGAARLWDRLLREKGAGIFADGTHLGRRKRVALVTGTAREVAALRAAGRPLVSPLLQAPLPPLD